AIKKCWKQAKNCDKELESGTVKKLKSRIIKELEPVEYKKIISEIQIEDSDKLLDAKSDEYDKYFSTFWIEDKKNYFNSKEIMDQLEGLQQNILEQLVKNAKTNIWTTSLCRPIYRDDTESILYNKKAYWKKAASVF
ncbi:12965_t:CDS:2, partial [Racocetra persica]